jgi:hypothetical protein
MHTRGKTNALIWLLFAFSTISFAQTTAFNFQGRLNDGSNPANGHYDLQFKLFDQIIGGIQVGATLNKPDLVLINGVFSTTLDFGGTGFTGADRFVEISVRPAGSPNAYVVLGGRQQILSVPFSIRAINAVNADSATTAAVATNAQNSFSCKSGRRVRRKSWCGRIHFGWRKRASAKLV